MSTPAAPPPAEATHAPMVAHRSPVMAMLLDSLAAAIIAALLAAPLLGVRLVDSAQGIVLNYRTMWIVYAAGIVFVGRLAILAGYAAYAHRPRVKVHRRRSKYISASSSAGETQPPAIITENRASARRL